MLSSKRIKETAVCTSLQDQVLTCLKDQVYNSYMLEIRKLKKEDREASYRLSQYSFGFWSDDPIPEDELDQIKPQDNIGGFIKGELVAKVRLQSSHQSVRGIIKPMTGISGVGTAPLHRKKGYMRQLMRVVFEEMRNRETAVSSLFPFLESFYAKFDYVTSNDYLWVKFPTQNLSHYLPFNKHTSEWKFNLRPAKDSFDSYLQFLTDIAPDYHGFVLETDLPTHIWQKRHAKDQFILQLDHKGVSVGMARYKISGNMEDGKLTLKNIFWKTLAARDRLFGYFAMHTINLPVTVMPVPFGVNFHTWFQDPTAPYEIFIDYVAMMCRVIDPIRAIEHLPAAQNGRFNFNYQDAYCPWVDGTYELIGENGRLHLQKTAQSTANWLNLKGLSALIFGTLPVEEIIFRGWSNRLEVHEINLLDRWLPTELVFNPNKF